MGAGPRMLNRMVVGLGQMNHGREWRDRGGMKQRKVAVLCLPLGAVLLLHKMCSFLPCMDPMLVSVQLEWVGRKASAELSTVWWPAYRRRGQANPNTTHPHPHLSFSPPHSKRDRLPLNSWASPRHTSYRNFCTI